MSVWVEGQNVEGGGVGFRELIRSVGSKASSLYTTTKDASSPGVRDGLSEVEDRLRRFREPLMGHWMCAGVEQEAPQVGAEEVQAVANLDCLAETVAGLVLSQPPQQPEPQQTQPQQPQPQITQTQTQQPLLKHDVLDKWEGWDEGSSVSALSFVKHTDSSSVVDDIACWDSDDDQQLLNLEESGEDSFGMLQNYIERNTSRCRALVLLAPLTANLQHALLKMIFDNHNMAIRLLQTMITNVPTPFSTNTTTAPQTPQDNSTYFSGMNALYYYNPVRAFSDATKYAFAGNFMPGPQRAFGMIRQLFSFVKQQITYYCNPANTQQTPPQQQQQTPQQQTTTATMPNPNLQDTQTQTQHQHTINPHAHQAQPFQTFPHTPSHHHHQNVEFSQQQFANHNNNPSLNLNHLDFSNANNTNRFAQHGLQVPPHHGFNGHVVVSNTNRVPAPSINKPSVIGQRTQGLSPQNAATCLEAVATLRSMLSARKGTPLKQPGLSRKLYALYPQYEEAIRAAGGLRAFVKRFPEEFRLFPGKGSVWFVMLREAPEPGSKGVMELVDEEVNDENDAEN